MNQWEETGASQTSHVDHANVLFQIPENDMEAPMIFLHGYGQSRMGWQTTIDDRDGWSDYFLRQGHSVWLVDQSLRGEAVQTSVAGEISTTPFDQRWYTQFRIGRWENGKSQVPENSQFPNDEESLNQFFRQMTPDTGMRSDKGADFDNEVVARALAETIDEVFERTGKKPIVATHSQGGGPGWTAARYTENIGAIVAIEPGGAPATDSEDYKAIEEQKILVTFYFGDYIDNGDEKIPATGQWKQMQAAAQTFVDALNDNGGNATLVYLPKEGIEGNSHFMFQEKNSDEIAAHIEDWIKENDIN
ncbi:alpha/beta fold hydrolase [Streptococcus sp. NLN64]|uniref:alpha/beta hydrolase n=1 Tax=Streptococcus sp. NLN64 TaxID=2822799 RepID=UPI0018CAEC00|nr:alpha/beta fold hydrolase [Streptococcus sp. NLN64]MBG9367308.1 alpha/beta fold hydrolase [Streptococcus sp. NLN64]